MGWDSGCDVVKFFLEFVVESTHLSLIHCVIFFAGHAATLDFSFHMGLMYHAMNTLTA